LNLFVGSIRLHPILLEEGLLFQDSVHSVKRIFSTIRG
jgi:hypothetical protein